MPRKLTYQEVKEFVENAGFELLSKEYKNALTKLSIKCDRGHVFEMRFNDFKNGHRCKYCAHKAKFTLQQVKEIVESRGYTLLESEYVNVRSHLNLICPKGHKCRIRFYAFKNRGDGCNECARLKRAKSNTFSYNEVKSFIEKAGYTLLSDSYKNSEIPLKIRCDRGHEFEMKLKPFKQGQRCPKCRSSRGECTVRFILHNSLPKNVKVFEQCHVDINGNRHYFDFFINYGKGIFIEYDGEQHYEKDHVWNSTKRRKRACSVRDAEKDEYVKDIGGRLIRIPYFLTKIEIYQLLENELSKYIPFKTLTPNDLAKAEYYRGTNFSIQEVAEYYLTHSCKDTANKFNVYELTVRNYFKQVYSMTKTEYINFKYNTNYSPAMIGALPEFNIKD